MGWIMMSSQTETEASPIENKKLLADEDIMRVLQWGAASYFSQGVHVPAVIDENGVEVTPASVRPPTGQEVHKAITDAIYAEITNQVEAYERRVAAEAAAASVLPLVLTPAT